MTYHKCECSCGCVNSGNYETVPPDGLCILCGNGDHKI
jgi:hypothetical protein